MVTQHVRNNSKQESRHGLYRAIAVLATALGFAILGREPRAFAADTRALEEQAGRIENMVVMPPGVHALASYDRYYTQGLGKDPYILGVFRFNPAGRGVLHFVGYGSLPAIFDGGCNVIRIRYSYTNPPHVEVHCNGVA
jgi:hypothetical protein